MMRFGRFRRKKFRTRSDRSRSPRSTSNTARSLVRFRASRTSGNRVGYDDPSPRESRRDARTGVTSIGAVLRPPSRFSLAIFYKS